MAGVLARNADQQNKRLDDRFMDNLVALSSADPRTRLNAILRLGGTKSEEALTSAQQAFQGHRTGRENIAAQVSIVRLCRRFPEKAGHVAATMVELLEARAHDSTLNISSDEFIKSCSTVRQVLRRASFNEAAAKRIDAALGRWCKKAILELANAPSSLTLVAPLELVRYQDRLVEGMRDSAQRVLSTAMLAALVAGVATPKATEIKLGLLAQIKPDGFGQYILEQLTAANDAVIRSEALRVRNRWADLVVTPRNRFFEACIRVWERLAARSSD